MSLDGSVNKVNGILPMCIEAKKLGIKRAIIPKENDVEASVVEGLEIIGVSSLKQVVSYLNGNEKIVSTKSNIEKIFSEKPKYTFDFAEVKGQENIKRALEVAAARRA